MSRIIHGCAGIFTLAIVLSGLALPTNADIPNSLSATDGTVSTGPVPIARSTGYFDAVTPNSMDVLSGEGSVPDHYSTYSPTESQFTELHPTIFDNISSSTQQTTQSEYSELVTTSNVNTTSQNVHSTAENFQNATSSVSEITSQIPTSNATLTKQPAAEEEEIDSVRREATNLRIGLIITGIIASLGIICSIILVVCLKVQQRKHKRYQTELGIEMKRQNRQSGNEKWPEMNRNSSTNDIDSESQISREETQPKRAPSPAGSSNIYVDPQYPQPELTSFTPPGNVGNNDHDIYISCDQDTEYYNQNAQNNAYYNENAQDNQVYNNIEDGTNQISPVLRREHANIPLSDSSEDTGIYSNFKSG